MPDVILSGQLTVERSKAVALIRIVLGVLGVVLVSACGPSLTDTEYVEKAQDYLDRGELESAAIELKNALQLRPDNPEARRLLGLVYFESGDMPGAEKELLRAREFGVVDESILPRLARALLQQKKYTDLQGLSESRLSVDALKAEVLATKGLGRLRQGVPEKAEGLIDQSIALAPESPYVHLAKAEFLFSAQDFDGADEELQKALALDQDYAPAWSLLGMLQKNRGRLVEAETSLSKAIEKRRLNSEDLLTRALVRIQLGNYESAQKDVDILKRQAPKLVGTQFAQGILDLQADRLQQAKVAFERALQLDEKQFLPKYYLALANLRLGNIEQADTYGEQVFAVAPRSISVRKVLARIKLMQKDFERVERLIRPILREREDDAEAVDLLAYALVGRNQHAEAIPYLAKLSRSMPESALVDLRLGSAFLATGRTDEGVSLIRKSLERDKNLARGHFLLVQHYAGLSKFDEALEAAESFRKSQPSSPLPLTLTGVLHLQRGAESDAVRAFERALEVTPGDPGASHLLAAERMKKEDLKGARAYLENVLEHRKDHLETLLKLADLDAIEKNESAMVARLELARAVHPSAAGPAVMLGRHYLAKGEPDKVAPLMVELGQVEKQDPGVLEVMVYAQLAQKQYEGAGFSMEELLNKKPDEARLHFLMATVKAGLNEADGMERALRRAVELEPEYFAARLALARLALVGNRRDMVRDQLIELEKSAADHPSVLDLKAKLASVEGEVAQASGLFEQVFEKMPNTQTMLSVARQKWFTGDPEEALNVQEAWIKDNPSDVMAMLALAETYMGRAEPGKAITQYENILQKDENNVYALNDLAWYLRDSDPVRALEYAQSAVKIAPDSAQVLDTLAMVQLSNKQFERASRSIERALRKAPEDASIRYHSAMIAQASGDIYEATKILSELLRDPAEFPERKEAEQMLNRLKRN